MWQAEAVKELTLSASPATAVGEQTLTLANRRYSTVIVKGYENMDLESQDPIFNANLGQDENLIWTKKLRCSHPIRRLCVIYISLSICH